MAHPHSWGSQFMELMNPRFKIVATPYEPEIMHYSPLLGQTCEYQID